MFHELIFVGFIWRFPGVASSKYVQVFVSLVFRDIKKKLQLRHKQFKKLTVGGPFGGYGWLVPPNYVKTFFN